MEDLNKLLQLTESYPMELENMTEEFLLKLRVILWGQAAITAHKEKNKNITGASPQQTKKRLKRLSSLNEDKESEEKLQNTSVEKNGKISQTINHVVTEILESVEVEENTNNEICSNVPVPAPRSQLAVVETPNNVKEENKTQINNSDATHLMPPPPAPEVTPSDELLNKRPQRAARLKTEKCLKEPSLQSKLRRPTGTKIKLEHEQRPSQMNGTISRTCSLSEKSDDSLVVIPGKQLSIISINSEIDIPMSAMIGDEQIANGKKENTIDSTENGIRDIRIKIKREKVSFDNQEKLPAAEPVFKVPAQLPLAKTEITPIDEKSLGSSILSSTDTSTAVGTKKTRKKKDVLHKPIKVERFSDLDVNPPPISSHTRHCTLNQIDNETSASKGTKRQVSVYEDAVENPPPRCSKEINTADIAGAIVNETADLGPSADATPADETFCTNPAQTTFQVAPGQSTFVMDSNPNATVTLNKHSGTGALADATFDINKTSKTVKDKEDDTVGQRSFQTAKDSSMPNSDSILTEDEQEKPIVTKSKVSSGASSKSKGATKTSTSAKSDYKLPTRKNELFNPLAQSPVKMRVEAFENAAAAATEQFKRLLRNKKENVTPMSHTTPTIGKLGAPALGRFLTPTQSSNVTPITSAMAKKGVTSASKVLPLIKSGSASSLQRSNSATSTKTLQRENSADDFRKGLQNLAEERKRQREQKHLLAAQQREAKERERAERMAKLAKEREEKRMLKKQQEQEQKKRELEEIQRKLRQQQEEEAAKIKAHKEREMHLQMKQHQLNKQKMLPPPTKTGSKYTFEMLHEDDSTDDEDKVSYKRPPPPSWSRRHVRGPVMLKQEYTPAAFIDSFFSVQPMTPDLKIIFPNIDPRHLKRNSSVLWSTPPRYSELPKY